MTAPFPIDLYQGVHAMEAVLAINEGLPGSRGWRALSGLLPGYRVATVTPLGSGIGANGSNGWDESTFAIAALIRGSRTPVHLIARGFAVCVALDVLRLCASRIASVTFVDPLASFLLGEMGPRGRAERDRLECLRIRAANALASARREEAAEAIVSFLHGPRQWHSLLPAGREIWIRQTMEACRMLEDTRVGATSLAVLRRLAIPLLIVETAAATAPARMLARRLHAVSRRSRYRLARAEGGIVEGMIADHLMCRSVPFGRAARPAR